MHSGRFQPASAGEQLIGAVHRRRHPKDPEYALFGLADRRDGEDLTSCVWLNRTAVARPLVMLDASNRSGKCEFHWALPALVLRRHHNSEFLPPLLKAVAHWSRKSEFPQSYRACGPVSFIGRLGVPFTRAVAQAWLTEFLISYPHRPA